MLKLAVCDDEKRIREDISRKVSEIIEGVDITSFVNGQELVSAFEESHFDIVLLDIDMPELSGLDVAGMIQTAVPKPLIIFVTSHDELVYDSLRFHPFGFVRKTHLEAELSRVLLDSVSEIESRDRSISVHTSDGDVRLSLKDILYFESDGNYIKAVTNDTEYRFRDTMTTLENTLQFDGFVRIHKGFLVNEESVKVFNADRCSLTNGEDIPMGRSFYEEARRKLMRSMIR